MDKEEKNAKRSKNYLQRRFSNATGKSGSDRGQFSSPTGVAFNWSNHQLVVSDRYNHRLQFLEREEMKHIRCVGDFGRQPIQFDAPKGLSFQPITNHLLVCDWGNHCLKMINQQDKVMATIGTTGQSSESDGLFIYPIGVACAPNGHFFVADELNSRVQLFDASGRFLGKYGKFGDGDQDLRNPLDVSVLDRRFAPSSVASSVVIVVDWFNNRLSVWNADGSQHIRNIQFESGADGVCVELNGFVCVSTDAHTVEVLDPRRDFACLQTIGSSWGSTPGKFKYPSGLCVDNTNTLIVADTDNHRLQFFV